MRMYDERTILSSCFYLYTLAIVGFIQTWSKAYINRLLNSNNSYTCPNYRPKKEIWSDIQNKNFVKQKNRQALPRFTEECNLKTSQSTYKPITETAHYCKSDQQAQSQECVRYVYCSSCSTRRTCPSMNE